MGFRRIKMGFGGKNGILGIENWDLVGRNLYLRVKSWDLGGNVGIWGGKIWDLGARTAPEVSERLLGSQIMEIQEFFVISHFRGGKNRLKPPKFPFMSPKAHLETPKFTWTSQNLPGSPQISLYPPPRQNSPGPPQNSPGTT